MRKSLFLLMSWRTLLGGEAPDLKRVCAEVGKKLSGLSPAAPAIELQVAGDTNCFFATETVAIDLTLRPPNDQLLAREAGGVTGAWLVVRASMHVGEKSKGHLFLVEAENFDSQVTPLYDTVKEYFKTIEEREKKLKETDLVALSKVFGEKMKKLGLGILTSEASPSKVFGEFGRSGRKSKCGEFHFRKASDDLAVVRIHRANASTETLVNLTDPELQQVFSSLKADELCKAEWPKIDKIREEVEKELKKAIAAPGQGAVIQLKSKAETDKKLPPRVSAFSMVLRVGPGKAAEKKKTNGPSDDKGFEVDLNVNIVPMEARMVVLRVSCKYFKQDIVLPLGESFPVSLSRQLKKIIELINSVLKKAQENLIPKDEFVTFAKVIELVKASLERFRAKAAPASSIEEVENFPKSLEEVEGEPDEDKAIEGTQRLPLKLTIGQIEVIVSKTTSHRSENKPLSGIVKVKKNGVLASGTEDLEFPLKNSFNCEEQITKFVDDALIKYAI